MHSELSSALAGAARLAAPFRISARSHLQARLIHNSINLGVAVGLTVLLGTALSLPTWLAPWFAVPLGSALVGWCLVGLIGVVVHEAAHGGFLLLRSEQRTRRSNLLAGRALAGALGVNFEQEWLTGHRRHHQRPLRPGDPQNCRAFSGAGLAERSLALLLIPGYAFALTLHHRSTAAAFGCAEVPSGTWRVTVARAFLTVGLLGLAGWASASLWPAVTLLGGVQVAATLNVIKVGLEHGGASAASAGDPRLRSRTTLAWWVALVAPFGLRYHFEHHLCPAVPWYRLRALHQAIADRYPELEGCWRRATNWPAEARRRRAPRGSALARLRRSSCRSQPG